MLVAPRIPESGHKRTACASERSPVWMSESETPNHWSQDVSSLTQSRAPRIIAGNSTDLQVISKYLRQPVGLTSPIFEKSWGKSPRHIFFGGISLTFWTWWFIWFHVFVQNIERYTTFETPRPQFSKESNQRTSLRNMDPNRTMRILEMINIYIYIYGWWYTYPSEKYEFLNGKDDIPYMKWKIKFMFQTRPPTIYIYTHTYTHIYIYIICD